MRTAPFPFDRGTGPVALLIHPFPLDHRSWIAAGERIATRARAVAVDCPGWGAAGPAASRSESVAPANSIAAMAADVGARLDACGVVPELVAGVSMGGYVALALAAARPDLVPRLALIDSRARADTDEERAGRATLVARLRGAGLHSGAVLVEALLPRLLDPDAPPALREMTRDWILEARLESVLSAIEAMSSRPDLTAVLRAFRGPVLGIAGAADPITTPEEVRGLTTLPARSAFRLIRGAGHLSQLERPDEVASALLGLLDTPGLPPVT